MSFSGSDSSGQAPPRLSASPFGLLQHPLPPYQTLASNSSYAPLAGVDFSPQARFGMAPSAVNPMPAVPQVLIPYGLPSPLGVPESLRQYGHLAATPISCDPLSFDKDGGAALAEGFERLQLNPMAKEYMPTVGQPLPGFYARNLYFYGPQLAYSRGGVMAFDGYQAPMVGRNFTGEATGSRDSRLQQRKKRQPKGLEDNVRKTVYISYIDQQVTEEQLATFFSDVGRVVDCRICGDPNSAMRFAFIEFTAVEAAEKAQSKTGAILGNSPLRVLPSKTAIVPVNKELMPRSGDDLERCSRTVYAANIDKKVDKSDVRQFFEQLCGPVSKIRLLGDVAHSTRIAFIEFVQAEGAMAALNCSGALLGSLPLRVSPSKTPVRTETHKDNTVVESS